jgi:RNA polymerase sigma factor (sigma-70 family)
MWSLSDESLLAGMASGDRDASAAFVRRFQARVFGLALAILHESGAAEDVAQETFVRAWKHAASYDPRRGRVPTWLLSITRNLAIDVLRLKRPESSELRLEEPLSVGGWEPAPEDAVAARDELERLNRALETLPEEQRHALLLATFGGRTAREIADLQGTPLGTAKTRIRTGMLRLRSELEVVDER